MSVSCRLRFEVFKRDSFICQYCGRKPPEVILHCDHILASSKGGSDLPENLLTSCMDCNMGKSNVPVDQVIGPINLSVEDRKERLDQLKAYEDFMASERSVYDGWTRELLMCWGKQQCQPEGKFSFRMELRSSIQRFLKQMPKSDIQNCILIAFHRFPPGTIDPYEREKYFFGVCWRTIKGEKPCSKAKPCM